MSDAEVMTTSIIAAIFFGGNMETTRTFLQEQVYIPNMLDKSRFNRRQHRIADLFLTLFNLLAAFWQELNELATIIAFHVLVAMSEKSGLATKPAKSVISMA